MTVSLSPALPSQFGLRHPHRQDAPRLDVLVSTRLSVLGEVARLAYVRSSGVQWNPRDHACAAGQLLCEPADQRFWTLSGQGFELMPRQCGNDTYQS